MNGVLLTVIIIATVLYVGRTLYLLSSGNGITSFLIYDFKRAPEITDGAEHFRNVRAAERAAETRRNSLESQFDREYADRLALYAHDPIASRHSVVAHALRDTARDMNLPRDHPVVQSRLPHVNLARLSQASFESQHPSMRSSVASSNGYVSSLRPIATEATGYVAGGIIGLTGWLFGKGDGQMMIDI